MSYEAYGRTSLDAREARQVEATSRALSRLPARAPIEDVFDAIRPCVPLAAGIFGIIRPAAPDSMVTRAVRLPPEVFESWLGTPLDQLARTLAPVIRSDAGALWPDSATVTGVLREELDVLRKLDAAGLGEGAGYKVLERFSPWHGVEHFMIAMIMDHGERIPPRTQVLLAVLNPAIASAILRLGLSFLEGEPILTQILAEESTGYICLSQGGAVLEANRRAYDQVTRFREAARVERGRGAVMEFGARARAQTGPGKPWILQADDPPSLLHVRAHLLAKETHVLSEDVLLLVMNELASPKSCEDDLLTRAGLTPREKQIALLLVDTPGSYKEIAAALERSVTTVDGHVRKIYEKLGVRSRPELTARLKK